MAISGFSARLQMFSDLELLAIVRDLLGEDGAVGTDDVLGAIYPEARNPKADPGAVRYARRSTGIRLAWMRRFGVLARHDRTGRWYLTTVGQGLVSGSLSRSQESLVEAIRDEKLPALVARLSRRYAELGDPVRHVARREWKHGTGER